MVTDYDCWHAEHAAVTVADIIQNLNANAANAAQVVRGAVRNLRLEARTCGCSHAAGTRADHRSEDRARGDAPQVGVAGWKVSRPLNSRARCSTTAWPAASPTRRPSPNSPASLWIPNEAIALSASRALLGTLVEGLADRFEPALCAAYAHLFAPVITRALPGLDGAVLTARYESVRRVRPPAFEPAEVFVLSRVTLGADIAVTSILMDGARQRFPKARLWFAGPRKAWELFEGAGARWSFLDVPYGRTGLLRDRLAPFDALREALDRPGVLLLDPDSRLTQLGLLPVCPASAHHLFESRGYGGETAATLPELARCWVRETLGVERAEPWFHPRYDHALPGRAVATVSFGIGENPAKRVPDPFEEEDPAFPGGIGLAGGARYRRAQVRRRTGVCGPRSRDSAPRARTSHYTKAHSRPLRRSSLHRSFTSATILPANMPRPPSTCRWCRSSADSPVNACSSVGARMVWGQSASSPCATKAWRSYCG